MTTRFTRPAPPIRGSPVGVARVQMGGGLVVRAIRAARSMVVAFQGASARNAVLAVSGPIRCRAKCHQRRKGLTPLPRDKVLSVHVLSN